MECTFLDLSVSIPNHPCHTDPHFYDIFDPSEKLRKLAATREAPEKLHRRRLYKRFAPTLQHEPYDKRRSFNLTIIRYAHFDPCLNKSVHKGIVWGRALNIYRCSSSPRHFMRHMAEVQEHCIRRGVPLRFFKSAFRLCRKKRKYLPNLSF